MHKKRISKKEMEKLADQLLQPIEKTEYLQVGIQVKPEVWNQFREISELEGLKLKHAINKALILWIEKQIEKNI
jgi:hypothetical protein